jgi:hypothetical protein
MPGPVTNVTYQNQCVDVRDQKTAVIHVETLSPTVVALQDQDQDQVLHLVQSVRL